MPYVEPEFPTRREVLLDVEILGGLGIGGDIISANWDGPTPIDLTTPAAITAGYALDSSLGTMQISANLFVGTDTSYIQINGVGGGSDAIRFHDEQGAGLGASDGDAFIVHDVSDQGGGIDAGSLWLNSFAWSSQDEAAILLHSSSNTATTPANISFHIGGTERYQMNKLALQPGSDSAYDLGLSNKRWATAYIDAMVGLDWQAWTVTYGNLTLGNGTEVARYVEIGDLIIAQYSLVFGSTTTIDGSAPTISTPVTAAAGASHYAVGQALIEDSGVGWFDASVKLESTTTFKIQVGGAAGTYVTSVSISATVPITFTTSDKIGFVAIYEKA